jgi:hypothetical protein
MPPRHGDASGLGFGRRSADRAMTSDPAERTSGLTSIARRLTLCRYWESMRVQLIEFPDALQLYTLL